MGDEGRGEGGAIGDGFQCRCMEASLAWRKTMTTRNMARTRGRGPEAGRVREIVRIGIRHGAQRRGAIHLAEVLHMDCHAC